jgi:hypothetical protein
MGKGSPGQLRQGSLGQARAVVLNSVTKPIGPVACSLPMLGKIVPSKFSENTQNRSPQDSGTLRCTPGALSIMQVNLCSLAGVHLTHRWGNPSPRRKPQTRPHRTDS